MLPAPSEVRAAATLPAAAQASEQSTKGEGEAAIPNQTPAPAAAPLIHMQGRALTVVSEQLVTSYHSKTGKPFSFVVCSVKEAA